MTLRIRAIAPLDLTEQELQRRQQRFDAMSPAGVHIRMTNLTGGPRQLNSFEDCEASERLMVQASMATDADQFDAIWLDCALDSGLDELERRCPLPALAITRSTAGALAAAGHRIGAVARNRAIADGLHQILARYLGNRFEGVQVLDLPFEAIADEGQWNAALSRAAAHFAERGVSVIINGCSAVNVMPERQPSVAVVDPTAFALKLLGTALSAGIPLPRPQVASRA